MKTMLLDRRLRAARPVLLAVSLLLASCGSVFDSQDDEASHQVAGSAFTVQHTWSFYLAIDPFRSVREKRLREQVERIR